MSQVKQYSNKAIISLILGILSIVLLGVGLILGIIGIIVSNKALKEVNDFETSRFLSQATIGRRCSFFGMWFQSFLIFTAIISVVLIYY